MGFCSGQPKGNKKSLGYGGRTAFSSNVGLWQLSPLVILQPEALGFFRKEASVIS